MLEQAIFNEITADATLAGKLQNGSKYNIFPSFIPEGVLPSKAITYSEISQSLTYPLVRTSVFQFSCFAQAVADAIGLANDLDRIFNDSSEFMLGGVMGVKYIKFLGRSTGYDVDAGLHQCVVEFLFKY